MPEQTPLEWKNTQHVHSFESPAFLTKAPIRPLPAETLPPQAKRASGTRQAPPSSLSRQDNGQSATRSPKVSRTVRDAPHGSQSPAISKRSRAESAHGSPKAPARHRRESVGPQGAHSPKAGRDSVIRNLGSGTKRRTFDDLRDVKNKGMNSAGGLRRSLERGQSGHKYAESCASGESRHSRHHISHAKRDHGKWFVDEDGLLAADRPLPVVIMWYIFVMPTIFLQRMLHKWWQDGLLTLALETICGYWYMYSLPIQLAFANPVKFDILYVISYALDGCLLLKRLHPIMVNAKKLLPSLGALLKLMARRSGSSAVAVAPEVGDNKGSLRNLHGSLRNLHGSLRRAGSNLDSFQIAQAQKENIARIAAERKRRLERQRQQTRNQLLRGLLHIIPFLPFDIFFWGGDLTFLVPYIRLVKLLYAPRMVNSFHSSVEISQLASFNVSRYFRIAIVFVYCSHWMACLLFFVSDRDVADHYRTAPWKLGPTDRNRTLDPADTASYLWASYWSVMSLTANNIDVIETGGRSWEIMVAIITVVCSTLCFMYMNSNITSLIMRHTQVLETYRQRLSQVDGYLHRNQVSKEVRRSVKLHFRMTLDNNEAKDKELLDQMPHTLRRQVLYDIHMRTMRRASLFFGVDPMMLQHLCNVVKRVTLLPGSLLCNEGDVMTEMYFLEQGSLLMYAELSDSDSSSSVSGDDDVKPIEGLDELVEEDLTTSFTSGKAPVEGNAQNHMQNGVLAMTDKLKAEEVPLEEEEDLTTTVETPGTAVATISFMFGMRQEVTVEAIKMSTCLVLGKESYLTVLKDFPEATKKVHANITSDLKARQKFSVIDAITALVNPSDKVAKINDVIVTCQSGDLQQLQKIVGHERELLAESDFDGRSCLHFAAAGGHCALVQWLCSCNVQLDKIDGSGKTALDYAVQRGHIDVVEALCSKGAELGWNAAEEGYQLCDFLRQGLLPKISLLLDCGVSPNSTTFDQRSVLHHAAADGNVRAVELLINREADVNLRDRNGCTPLRDAVRADQAKVALMIRKAGGQLGMDDSELNHALCDHVKSANEAGLRLLIECGADVNVTSPEGRTALHTVALFGNLTMAKMLVEAGAKVDAADRLGATPLRDALRGGFKELASFLRANGGSVGLGDTETFLELCSLARSGDTATLETLLQCGASVDAADPDKRTCLHFAASEGNLAAVDSLLAHNALVNAKDRWGNTPLREAVREGHKAVAKRLRDRGGTLDLSGEETASELCKLTRSGSLDLLKMMLQSGASVNATDHDQRSCMHFAAAVGNIPIVVALLAADADPNLKDRWGTTPLVDALRNNHMEMAEFLHSNGGELEWDELQTAAELCKLARRGSLDLLKTMLECGADINAADYDFRTCLHVAASEGALKLVEALIAEEADINYKDRWGGTPLRDAVRHGHWKVASAIHEEGGDLGFNEVEAAQELSELTMSGSTDQLRTMILCGINVNAADYDKRTPLHIAASKGELHILEALIDAGAEVNALDNWGNSPLQDAVYSKNEDCMLKLISVGAELRMDTTKLAFQMCSLAREGKSESIESYLKCGVDVNIRDYDYRTPLHVAASEGHKAIVKKLIEWKAENSIQDRWGSTPILEATKHNWDFSIWVA